MDCLKKFFTPKKLDKHTFSSGMAVEWGGKTWVLVLTDDENAYLLSLTHGDKICVPLKEITRSRYKVLLVM